jgi:putative protein-disulfide isomerase
MTETMLRKLSFLFSILFLACQSDAQDNCPVKNVNLLASNAIERQQLNNTIFPSISVRTLQKNELELPNASMGKPTIICVVLKDEGRPIAASWTKAFLAKYGKQEINLFEIAMLPKGLKIIRGAIEKGMRKDVDSSFHSQYSTYFGSLDIYKKGLLMADNNNSYVYVLDKTGKIQLSMDGYYAAEKGDSVFQKVKELTEQVVAMNEMSKKDTIRFVFDPLCGFCYAFEPEMKKLVDQYKSKFVFDIIAGGMIIGKDEGPIGKVAPHIAYGYKQLEKMSTVKFGDKFLNGILKEGSYQMSSEMPSIAVAVFKSMQPENAIAFAADVQKMFYYDGMRLNEPANYKALVTKYGLDAETFAAQLVMPEWKAKTYAQFKQTEMLGISGFPALLFLQNGQSKMIAAGFEKYENLVKKFPFANAK